MKFTNPLRTHALDELANKGARPWLLQGIGFDVTAAYELLRQRRTTPFFPGKNCQDEARICAQYVTDRDCTLDSLCGRLHTRYATVRSFLMAWGIDPKTRSIREYPPQS